MRRIFLFGSISILLLTAGLSFWSSHVLWTLLLTAPLIIEGFRDYLQKSQAIKRNFPLLGRFRYVFEAIRPEINQYFVESNTDGVPFSREKRSVVYQRAKGQVDTLPFGTQQDVYAEGYEWVSHSLAPTHIGPEHMRVMVGGPDCLQPYSASTLNISAMSYGSLSKNAIQALNGAAKDGGFAHNTGEGGLSPYHLENGGDLIWQIGTGYFSCRNTDGSFSEELFADKSKHPSVKMIEIKLSQGAKPSHGGILPASKVTLEISRIRNVPMGFDVVSPPAHSAFSTPLEMIAFIKKLRTLSGGKPIGIKLALGKKREFLAICKAMQQTGIAPDYIAVDGGEGGTGAAPLEFSNHVGSPGVDALVFIHNALVGFNLRSKIKIFNSGKVTTGFEMLKRIALGADVIYCARGMLLSLGCIQALKCNTNHCPTGVATQDPQLVAGLVVSDKRKRAANFHRETVSSFKHMIEAMGLAHPAALRPWHVLRRSASQQVRSYGDIYEYIEPGALMAEEVAEPWASLLEDSSADTFGHSSVRAQQRDRFRRAG
jgi:glutamate synthase domain-containing protein 2